MSLPKEQTSYEAIRLISAQIKDLNARIKEEFEKYPPLLSHYEKKEQKLQNNIVGKEFEEFMEIWNEKLKEIKKDFQINQKYADLFAQLANYKMKKAMHEEILLHIYLERMVKKEPFLLYDLWKKGEKQRRILNLKFSIKWIPKDSEESKIIPDFEYDEYEERFGEREEE